MEQKRDSGPFSSWWPAADALRAVVLAPPTQAQQALADQLEVKLPAVSPAAVATAVLDDYLEPILGRSPAMPPTEPQVAFLRSLAQEAAIELSTDLLTRRTTSAWIDVLLGRRTLGALEKLRPSRGDVVDHSGRSAAPGPRLVRRFRISSVAASGLLYFRGGNGQCGWPTNVELVARVGDAEAESTLSEGHARVAYD